MLLFLSFKGMSVTRPVLPDDAARVLLAEHWGIEQAKLAPLDAYDDVNVRVDWAAGRRAVLKVLHAEIDEAVVALQAAMMECLAAAGVVAPRALPTLTGAPWVRVQLGQHAHVARLLAWVPGRDYATVPPPQRPQLARELGRLVAQVDAALATVQPVPAAAHRESVWVTSYAHLIRSRRPSVQRRQTPARLALWDATVAAWEGEWRAQAAALARGLVHNDINDRNVLVDEDVTAPLRIAGVLDLGDACVEAYALALGNTVFYALLGLAPDAVVAAARGVVHGYCQLRPLSPAELRMVAVGARMRCLVSATMAGATSEAR